MATLEASARVNASRANARQSTGPRSAAGKARAARNARRHGLAVAIAALPDYEPEVAQLTRLIAGEGAGAERIVEARRVAETQLDLLRIRRVRLMLMRPEAEMADEAFRSLARLDRYERSARRRRKAAVVDFDRLGRARPAVAALDALARSRPRVAVTLAQSRPPAAPEAATRPRINLGPVGQARRGFSIPGPLRPQPALPQRFPQSVDPRFDPLIGPELRCRGPPATVLRRATA